MNTIKSAIFMVFGAALLLTSCAVSPAAESRHQAVQEDIATVLNAQLDPAEFGETKRCLADTEYDNFRALDDQHILFDGRGDKQWINTLRMPCPDLRYGDVLVVRQFSNIRMCDTDDFTATEWFGWPWYRRWPWHWGQWATGAECSLGKFQPVTKGQVAEIEAIIKSR